MCALALPCTVWKAGTGASLSSEQRQEPGKDAGQVLRRPAALSHRSGAPVFRGCRAPRAGNPTELGAWRVPVAGFHDPRFRKSLPTLTQPGLTHGGWRLLARPLPAWPQGIRPWWTARANGSPRSKSRLLGHLIKYLFNMSPLIYWGFPLLNSNMSLAKVYFLARYPAWITRNGDFTTHIYQCTSTHAYSVLPFQTRFVFHLVFLYFIHLPVFPIIPFPSSSKSSL